LAPQTGQAALVGDELVALTPALWQDPDVRWLTGAHEDKGVDYLVRESYEELLWWLQVPSLLRLASDPIANRASALQMSMVVEDALLTAEAASYRIDVLRGDSESEEATKVETEPQPTDEAAMEAAEVETLVEDETSLAEEPKEKTAKSHGI